MRRSRSIKFCVVAVECEWESKSVPGRPKMGDMRVDRSLAGFANLPAWIRPVDVSSLGSLHKYNIYTTYTIVKCMITQIVANAADSTDLPRAQGNPLTVTEPFPQSLRGGWPCLALAGAMVPSIPPLTRRVSASRVQGPSPSETTLSQLPHSYAGPAWSCRTREDIHFVAEADVLRPHGTPSTPAEYEVYLLDLGEQDNYQTKAAYFLTRITGIGNGNGSGDGDRLVVSNLYPTRGLEHFGAEEGVNVLMHMSAAT
ncbi:hypothetical protein AG1IA_09559 [Rhizoctonia solani AG-1 IA]|uniref:Uncharacterized protein n=1 Tax=Thanatephorus cucumeris (strain AG1-IA) TaxID=983506 RepID=L8WE09_THACA|nr:hypothetical protein AG1IA_09559 [Rhizoctonia solani AG-1 IA]